MEGYEFTMMTYAKPGFAEGPRVIEAIVGYWQQIGLKPKVRVSEWSVFRKAWMSEKLKIPSIAATAL